MATQTKRKNEASLSCKACGIKMPLRSASGALRKSLYCSISCAKVSIASEKRNMKLKKCIECKKIMPIGVDPKTGRNLYAVYRKKKFCSVQCRADSTAKKSRKILGGVTEKTCVYCKNKMVRKPTELLCHWAVRKFCDLKCVGAYASKRQTIPDEKLKKRRHHSRLAKTIKTQPWCERCMSEKFLQVHHKNRNWRDNTIGNLEVLCFNCHNAEHRGDAKNPDTKRKRAEKIRLKTMKKHIDRYGTKKCPNCYRSMWNLAMERLMSGNKTHSMCTTLRQTFCCLPCFFEYRKR